MAVRWAGSNHRTIIEEGLEDPEVRRLLNYVIILPKILLLDTFLSLSDDYAKIS